MSKQIVKSPFKIGASSVQHALRSVGYTNYTAIADILDNSIDADAKNIYVDVVKSKVKNSKEVDSIIISDDGCGMTLETLQKAMNMVMQDDKNSRTLGFYGAGMKTAAISIGRVLTVLSKTEESGVSKAVLDIDDVDQDNDQVMVSYDEVEEGSDDFKLFTGKIRNAKSGTVVIISKLDQIQNKDTAGFSGTLTKNVRILFNKYISDNHISFYVNNKKLTYFDVIGSETGMGTELWDEIEFEYEGSLIKMKVWYIPSGGGREKSKDFDDTFGRTKGNCGIYIYRNLRMVGQALDLGMFQKDGNRTNGLRIELYLNGEVDKLFGTTFTKMVTEKDRTGINQGFYDKLQSVIGPQVTRSNRTQKEENKDFNTSSEMETTLDRTKQIINNNPLLSSMVRQRGHNSKKEKEDNEPNPKKTEKKARKQVNPNPIKVRKGDWFYGFTFVNNGITGEMFNTVRLENERTSMVEINVDHAFYKEIFKKLDSDGQHNLAVYLACEYPALQDSDYYCNDSAEKYINNYKEKYSDAVRKAFM